MKINSIMPCPFKGRIKKGDIKDKTSKAKENIDIKTKIANSYKSSELKTDAATAGLILIAIPVAGTIGTSSEI